MFVGEQQTWLQKKAAFDQRLVVLNKVFEQSLSNTTKTLPQYCAGKEAQCFQDGVAKYQSGWYWNNAIQRIKTVELKVNNQFETVLEITDNALETQYELNWSYILSAQKNPAAMPGFFVHENDTYLALKLNSQQRLRARSSSVSPLALVSP